MHNELYFLNESITAKTIKNKNWDIHPMGPPEGWPKELKTVLAILFRSKQPMFLFWGKDAFCFYNDSYLPTFEQGLKHIGEEGKKSWGDIWPIIKPKINQVLNGGEATWDIDHYVPLKRNGVYDDAYWTYSYSPILDNNNEVLGVFSTGLETTDQVISRKNLKTSEAKMRGILEGSTDYVAALDLAGYVMLFNSALGDECFKVYGRYPKVGDHISMVFGETHEQNDSFEKSWQRAINGESFTTIDKYDFDGINRYFQITYSPIRDEDGVLIGTTKNARDITKFKNNEDALRESESSFRALSETMPQIVWTADSRGLLQYINPKGADYTGRPTEECLGNGILSSIHRDDMKNFLKKWKAAVDTRKSLSIECRLKSRAGTYKWFLFRALIYSSKSENNTWKWVGTCTNIHNHKILLEQLSKSEERLNLALESGHIGLWDWSLSKNQVYMSHTCSQAWELGNKNKNLTLDACIELVHEDDRANVWDSFFLSAHTGKHYDIDYRLANDKDGETTWINAKGKCFLNKYGRLARVTGVVINVTNNKRATIELQKAKADAESANKLKSAFLANMSHEIRTPLGVIAGFTDLLRSEQIKKSEKKQYSDIVSRTTTQLSTIIDDILDLSKVEAGELTTQIEDVAIDKLIKEVVSALRVKAKERNIVLKTELSDIKGITIGTDPIRTSQILFNLIGNAIKFTSNGSVSVEATISGNSVRFYVIDTGIGISKDKQKLLFKPFSQIDPSITRQFGGSGLGLTLSKKLANVLRGDIVLISSEPSKGSVFCLEIEDQGTKILSVQNLEQKSESKSTSELNEKISGRRVLLVEDVKENQILFSKFLTDRGAFVEFADNGEIGVEMAMKGEFDCVLMDIQMPIMDGFSAAKYLRSRGYEKPIIALTAHAMNEAKDQCLESGCNDFITKPLNAASLYRKIHDLTEPKTAIGF